MGLLNQTTSSNCSNQKEEKLNRNCPVKRVSGRNLRRMSLRPDVHSHTHVLHVGVVSIVESFSAASLKPWSQEFLTDYNSTKKKTLNALKYLLASQKTTSQGVVRRVEKKTAKRSSEPLTQGRYLAHQRDHPRRPHLRGTFGQHEERKEACAFRLLENISGSAFKPSCLGTSTRATKPS